MSSTHAVHLSKAPIKREVITLSDSDEDDSKPVEKKVKKEEEESTPAAPPPPSTPLSADEADALREQLAKSEKLRDSACRSARIAKRRAESAEEQLENKHDIVARVHDREELAKKEFAKEKEEWARRKSEWEAEKDVLVTANNLYKDKELEWNNERSKLQETNVISNGINHKLTLENNALKKEMEDLKAKKGNKSSAELEREIATLKAAMQRNKEVATARTEELKEKLEEAHQKSELDRTRIRDLTTRITEYEGGKAPPMQQKFLHVRPSNVNLLQLVRPGIANAVSIEEAVDDIRAAFDQCCKHKGYKEFMNYGKIAVDCVACGTKVYKSSFVDHFLTPDHIEEVRAAGGAVSLHAMLYWEKLLKEAAKGAAAAAAAEAGAALAALPTKQQPAESGENSDQEAEY